MKRIRLLVFFSLLIAALLTVSLFAGPTIVRDNRVTDTATTPVLGRGYSLGTNTYQSICLKNVQLTEPSYDMEYKFESGEDLGTRRSSTTRNTVTNYSLSKAITTSRWRSSNRRSYNYSRAASTKSTVVNGETWYNHDVWVTIDLYSYYASVDESKSKMSDSAAELLRRKDIPGFFNACGTFYVRSIGRKAKFVSKFSYKTKETTRDSSFESQLRTKINSFSTKSKNSRFLFWGSKKKETTSTTRESLNQTARTFNETAESRSLTIESQAFGLGKNEKATIISYDLDSFKAAIKDAFLSMQNPRTGKVSSIEVVPWVENTEFQVLVPLEEKPEPEAGTTTPAATTETPATATTAKVEKKLNYEKKLTLNANGEFMIEVMRVDRNLWNMYYKAKLCRQEINTNWKRDGNWKEKELENAMLLNNKDKETVYKLKDLDSHLNTQITSLYTQAQNFMKDKASACINRILKEGIYQKMHYSLSECTQLRQEMGTIQDTVIEHYCMPTLAYIPE